MCSSVARWGFQGWPSGPGRHQQFCWSHSEPAVGDHGPCSTDQLQLTGFLTTLVRSKVAMAEGGFHEVSRKIRSVEFAGWRGLWCCSSISHRTRGSESGVRVLLTSEHVTWWTFPWWFSLQFHFDFLLEMQRWLTSVFTEEIKLRFPHKHSVLRRKHHPVC